MGKNTRYFTDKKKDKKTKSDLLYIFYEKVELIDLVENF